jgi:hypothetical protein
MVLADRIALAGVFVAIIAIGIPIVFELMRQRRRADCTFHYWFESFAQTAHYCASTIQLGEAVGEDLRLTFQQRLESCLDSFGENAEFIEGRLNVTQQEDKTRDTYKLFNLMTTELQRRACNPIDLNAALFNYFASAVIALLLNAKDPKAEAIDTWFSLRRDTGRVSRSSGKGRVLPWQTAREIPFRGYSSMKRFATFFKLESNKKLRLDLSCGALIRVCSTGQSRKKFAAKVVRCRNKYNDGRKRGIR